MASRPISTAPPIQVTIANPGTGYASEWPLPVNSTVSGWSQSSVKTVTVNSSSTQLLSSNDSRKFVCICNNTSSLIYIQLGAPAIYGSFIRLNAGARLTMSGSDVFFGEINAVGMGSTAIDVIEGV